MIAWFEGVTGLYLRDPEWFALLALLALFIAIRSWRGHPAGTFGFAKLILPSTDAGNLRSTPTPLPRSWRVQLAWLPRALSVVGIGMAIVAMTRPVERIEVPPDREGIDLLLCIDVSSSMALDDLDGRRRRIDVARAAATRFIPKRRNDQFGVVTFARYCDVVSPVTRDHGALLELLADVELVESDGPEDATALGAGVARCCQLLSGSSAATKVIILLTDGEENVATKDHPDEIAPVHAAQLCREFGVRVYSILIGKQSTSGGETGTPIDASALRRLATMTTGEFFVARDEAALDQVYATIDLLEASQIDEPLFRLEERFLGFLVVAMAMIVGAWWLESTIWETLP